MIVIFISLLAFVLGFVARVAIGRSRLMSEKKLAEEIKKNILSNAENQRKEQLLQAKDKILHDRREFEIEVREKKQEFSQTEKRLLDRERQIGERLAQAKVLEDSLANKEKQIEKQVTKYEEKLQELATELERVSGYSAEQATEVLMKRLEDKARDRAMRTVNRIEQEAREQGERKARWIIGTSLQRLASEHTADATSSAVHLPNDEMKGRIIGREGRNIRAIEILTGVDIIVDDTPETVIVSCFDPVRREIAKISIERLIQDGRIQPSRIEEIVLKVKSEIDEIVLDAGEKARMELKIPILHPDVIKFQGRLKYRTSYGQNVLDHVKEVAMLSGMIAAELGEDVALAVRAGFLHDIGKAITVDGLGSHPEIGADFLKRVGEHERVVYAARHHHDNSANITDLNCLIVMTADAISASRPGARDKAIENYIKRLTDLENIALTYEGVDKAFAIQAGRELRVIVHNEMVSDEKARLLAKDIVEEIEESMVYPGQIKVAVIRESRAIEYAQ
jgi:ribonuclease Y